jgi:glycosyltransferase involved in cell wall biosynthesis
VKILVLTNLYPPHHIGGYEVICYTVVQELRRRGHDLHILTSNHGLPRGARENSECQVERSLSLHGLYGHPWLGIHRLQRLERHNNATLRNVLDQFRPDLVYIWNMGGLSKSLLLTLQENGVPTVFYVSDHWLTRGLESDVWLRWWNSTDGPLPRRWLRSFLTRSGLRRRWHQIAPVASSKSLRFDRIYFCSRALREITGQAGLEVAHGAVIYVPVDMRIYNGEPKGAGQPLKRLLYVGRLAPDKGVMTALRALAFSRGKFSGGLSIYGQGEPSYVARLKQFAAENCLAATFGFAAMRDMPAIYRCHDVLVFPSEWAEPFALTPIEAMASGLPVIGTTTGGSAELFRHNDNALTYAAGNAHELAERIVQLAKDTDRRCQLAATGRAEARAKYDVPVIVDQIEHYLTESLPARRFRPEFEPVLAGDRDERPIYH